MIILNVKDLSFSFGVNLILDGLSFTVESGDRCGVVGVNGSGKSTLFSLLNGEYEPDAGSIQYAKGISRSYFRQNNDAIDDITIGDAVHRVFADVLNMEAELEALERRLGGEYSPDGAGNSGASGTRAPRLAEDTPPDGARAALLNKYDRLRMEFELADGYEYRSRIRGVLNGLDIGDGIDDATPVSILSGGQKTRLALALMLIKPPDLLLLDEPTNHLDVSSLEWLESYLKNYRKSLLVVSHDRYFLDAVATRTFELERRKLTAYPGGYTDYVNKKEADRVILERQYENQQEEIERLEAIIEQFRRWNTERSHIAAKSREKQLGRIERIDRPSGPVKKVNIRFNNTVSNSQDALYIDGVSKGYDGRRLFRPFSATVRRNDRIMILGPNGCGKSTLLRILSGRLEPDAGGVEAGHRIEMDYYDQEHFDLHDEKTVLYEIYDEFPDMDIPSIRNMLGAFLFSGDDIYKKVAVLSGGEKARVALVKLVLSKANMLLLDEPTNHLDINTREKLEAALAEFNGVIIAVSHDRYFIRKLGTRIFNFNGGRIHDFAGGYDEFLRLAAAGKNPDGAGKNTGGANIDARSEPGSKINWLEARENRSRLKKSETRIAKLEARIETIEKRLAEINFLMHTDGVASDHVRLTELISEQEELNAELEGVISEWEEVSGSLT